MLYIDIIKLIFRKLEQSDIRLGPSDSKQSKPQATNQRTGRPWQKPTNQSKLSNQWNPERWQTVEAAKPTKRRS